MSVHWFPKTVVVLVVLLVKTSHAKAQFSELDFESQIRPALVSHCLKCHGPEKQESDLRVDSRQALLNGGISGPAIVPGDPNQGTLIKAMSHQGDVQMPPKGKLDNKILRSFEQWILAGADWPDESSPPPSNTTPLSQAVTHWAFQPVSPQNPPTVQNPAWPKSDIDRFVLKEMERHGLNPVADADRTTLIRRVTFELTGLPPKPEEIENFLQDDSPTAFARVVDRLLDSPRYGERWGRHWLDVARYADTAGDGSDYPVREAYKYRDWVIDALNQDLPFEDFIRLQIAGDLIEAESSPEAYAHGVTATGFLAVGKRYGYNPGPDFQHLDFADVIDSLGRSLMGLSIGCARCHDHKYEPISTEDYYALYGILQSTQWAFPGGEEMQRPTQFPPLIAPVKAERLKQEKEARLNAIDQSILELKNKKASLDGSFHAGGIDLAFEGQEVNKPLKSPWLSQGPVETRTEAQSPFSNVHPPGNQGVYLGTGQLGDGIRYVFAEPRKAGLPDKVYFSVDFRPHADSTATGSHRLYLGRGVIASLAVEFSLSKSEFAVHKDGRWEVLGNLRPGQWSQLCVEIDTTKRIYSGTLTTGDNVTHFTDLPIAASWDGTIDTFICDGHGHAAGSPAEFDLDNLALQATPFAPIDTTISPKQNPENIAELQVELDTEISKLQKEREHEAAVAPFEVAYAVSEGNITNARIQERGEPERQGREVPRRFLEILGGMPLENPNESGRRELANWIASTTNPLTARVFVNRVWGWHFGRGIVSTPSDFGIRGDLPSHPELLDWLTQRFLDSGGSLKSLHREILLSRTYQLSSDLDENNLSIDPENKFLWHFARRPLDAESLRDAILAISGELDLNRPGPHPFPDVSTWKFTIHNPFYANYPSNHRSVFLMQQRNRRQPFLALFDGADPNISTAQRLPTITPSQTLFLMNSEFVHEQSRAFAQKLAAHNDEEIDRIRLAFLMTTGRIPSEQQIQNAQSFLNAYTNQVGETSTTQVETWSALARTLFSSNAFLYID